MTAPGRPDDPWRFAALDSWRGVAALAVAFGPFGGPGGCAPFTAALRA